MAEPVVMPQLGESVTEGTVSKWLVKVGDRVKKYDSICEVATDKVVAEVPSVAAGTIAEIVVQEGETVAVQSLICYIATDEEVAPAETAASRAPKESAPAAQLPPIREAAAATAPAETKQRFSPAVMKLAQEYGIDLSLLRGTGAGGRITRLDVLEFVENKNKEQRPPVPETAVQKMKPLADSAPSPSSPPSPPVPSGPSSPKNVVNQPSQVEQDDKVIPITSVRRTIANRMVQSKHDAPHAWMMVSCDVTNLVRFRNQIKDDFKEQEGVALTFMPFFIKAVVEAIKEFPLMNSQWAGDCIIVKKAIHVSIAVASEDALFVPVIKDADQKSILGLAKAVDHLAVKSRAGKLTMEDISGGTFTVNNTGSFGSVLSAPIINQPQAAILSFEAIEKRPVAHGDMFAIRDMMNICLSLDHRVLDGLICGRFLQSVKSKIESYSASTKLY
ncbi:2-oxo acid dehydrogenase subunit E2 [Paenibacillus donghaensis]|uniref:dihydrolipoamide acetyltransferase family protein n=1 Tax=Paenibacillus donghaensis TaxID=414771 RepID=UPI001D16BB19|nr:dihydrolipoamide acetyltransferase family protein [Paenibacillus donghaensis]MBE9914248.1 2-oxo acid dehydrogenase subunit E2 [Paenibacillus donghaensis]